MGYFFEVSLFIDSEAFPSVAPTLGLCTWFLFGLWFSCTTRLKIFGSLLVLCDISWKCISVLAGRASNIFAFQWPHRVENFYSGCFLVYWEILCILIYYPVPWFVVRYSVYMLFNFHYMVKEGTVVIDLFYFFIYILICIYIIVILSEHDLKCM